MRAFIAVALAQVLACADAKAPGPARPQEAQAAVEAWFAGALRGDCDHLRAATTPALDAAQCATLVEEFQVRETELLEIASVTRDGRVTDGFVVTAKLRFPHKRPSLHTWTMRAQRRGGRWEVMRP